MLVLGSGGEKEKEHSVYCAAAAAVRLICKWHSALLLGGRGHFHLPTLQKLDRPPNLCMAAMMAGNNIIFWHFGAAHGWVIADAVGLARPKG